jgi:photosystem II stability/assembly factor-like uncharacterized protein
MNARRLTTVLSCLVITAVCGLVLASRPPLRQGRKATHTANGRAGASSGAHWRWQNPLPQGNNLRGASVVNANTSTLVGDYGTIVRTTDGGNNWTIQSSGMTQGQLGTILRTIDAGESWLCDESGTNQDLYGVSFPQINAGTAVGSYGAILRTTTQGPTPRPTVTPRPRPTPAPRP